MSLKKYISFEEARKDLWVIQPDAEYYKHLKELFRFWEKVTKRKIKTGIEKGGRRISE